LVELNGDRKHADLSQVFDSGNQLLKTGVSLNDNFSILGLALAIMLLNILPHSENCLLCVCEWQRACSEEGWEGCVAIGVRGILYPRGSLLPICRFCNSCFGYCKVVCASSAISR